MNRLYLIAILSAVILSGCTKERMPEVNPDEGMVLVHLNLDGEVDVDETPLTRAFTTNDLIGVQVYQGSSPYAYGLFDDVSNINIYLNSGETYSFYCTVLKNGKNHVYSWSSTNRYYDYLPVGSSDQRVGRNQGEYSLPFVKKINTAEWTYTAESTGVFTDVDYTGTTLDNTFLYSDTDYFVCLKNGTVEKTRKVCSKYPSGADRFYGAVSNYKATIDGSLVIPLKRVSFGLTLSVSGITDGNVAVTIKNSVQTFANNTGITTDKQFGTTTWSFFDLANVYKYADNYAENFTVGVVWNRGVGVTQNLGTKTVQFKRNVVNHVKIKLSTATRSSDFQIALDEPEITNETYSFCD